MKLLDRYLDTLPDITPGHRQDIRHAVGLVDGITPFPWSWSDLHIAQNAVRVGRTARTTNKLMTLAVGFARWASSVGEHPMPFGALRPIKERRKRYRHALTRAQARALLDAAEPSPVAHSLIHAALATGFRLSELLDARKQDWEDRRRLIRPGERTKTGQPRVSIELYPEAAAAIDRWLETRKRDKDRIWPFTQHKARALLADAMELAKLPRVDPDGGVIDWHALRHTVATWGAAAGVPGRSLQKVMGHESPTTTNRYIDVAAIDTSAATTALQSALC